MELSPHMNGGCFATGCRKIDVDFFRSVGPIVLLMEGENKRDRGTSRDRQSRSWGKRCAGAIIGPCPKRRTTQACTLQNQRFIIPLLVSAIVVPDHKYILNLNGPGIGI